VLQRFGRKAVLGFRQGAGAENRRLNHSRLPERNAQKIREIFCGLIF
jgi:hypothetical protein